MFLFLIFLLLRLKKNKNKNDLIIEQGVHRIELVNYDVIIKCTGYSINLDFLHENIRKKVFKDEKQQYLNVWLVFILEFSKLNLYFYLSCLN